MTLFYTEKSTHLFLDLANQLNLVCEVVFLLPKKYRTAYKLSQRETTPVQMKIGSVLWGFFAYYNLLIDMLQNTINCDIYSTLWGQIGELLKQFNGSSCWNSHIWQYELTTEWLKLLEVVLICPKLYERGQFCRWGHADKSWKSSDSTTICKRAAIDHQI